MSIFAIADPHLSFAVPNKSMDVFGPQWVGYTKKMEEHWKALVSKDDLVLIAGDISWAMRLEDAIPDLEWLASLPGTKVIIKGNHDFWWPSTSKMAQAMPASVHFIHNTAFNWNDVTIGGSRLWDTVEYRFDAYIHFQENQREAKKPSDYNPLTQKEADQKIFTRELQRLRLSLQQLDPNAKLRIAMTHYPPIGADLAPSQASAILEEFRIDACVFGHLHSVKKDRPMFGERNGVKYLLTSCDYLDFIPLQVR